MITMAKKKKSVINRIFMFLLAVVVVFACIIPFIPDADATITVDGVEIMTFEEAAEWWGDTATKAVDAMSTGATAVVDALGSIGFGSGSSGLTKSQQQREQYLEDSVVQKQEETAQSFTDLDNKFTNMDMSASYTENTAVGVTSYETTENDDGSTTSTTEFADGHTVSIIEDEGGEYMEVVDADGNVIDDSTGKKSTESVHYYSTINPESTQFKNLMTQLADADSEGDLKKIMGKSTSDNVKQMLFTDIKNYTDDDGNAITNDDGLSVYENLVRIWAERAMSLKDSLGNSSDADWLGSDIQNSWSNSELVILSNNFETWFPGFMHYVCKEDSAEYGGPDLVRAYSRAKSKDGDDLWQHINYDELYSMVKGLTMIDIIKGNYDEPIDVSSYAGVLRAGEDGYFSFRSGVTLSDVFDDPDDAFKALFVGAVAGGYANALYSITNVTDSTQELLEQGLDPMVGKYWDGSVDANGNYIYNYDGEGEFIEWEEPDFSNDSAKAAESVIYDAAKDIGKSIMVPVAAVILAFVFAYEIYELVCERNNMNDIGGGTFVQLILKLVIAIILVAYAWEIIELVFNLGSMIVSMTVPIAEGHDMGANTMLSEIKNYTQNSSTVLPDTKTGVKWIIAVEICLNASIDFGNTLVLLVQAIIIEVGTWVLSLIIYIIVYVRLIEMFIDCCVAPIPLATLTNRSWQQTGMNFLRSVFALALQAFIIYFCLAIFNILVSHAMDSILVSADINGTMWSVIGYSLILIFCLFKSGGLSKSIMAAH